MASVAGNFQSGKGLGYPLVAAYLTPVEGVDVACVLGKTMANSPWSFLMLWDGSEQWDTGEGFCRDHAAHPRQ